MNERLGYREAGVDIGKKSRLLADIGPLVRSTFSSAVRNEVGSFGGIYSAAFPGYEKPLLVATNDGVGTKVRLAFRAGQLRGLGHDIVNHCVNDILVQGARPLFFFDYVAGSRLEPVAFREILEGLVEACRRSSIALLGGETAEMPGTYASDEMDVVGFLVGVVEEADVWPQGVKAGQRLVGIRSAGLHTNGYSLVNRLLERDGVDLHARDAHLGESVAEAFLRPHRTYLEPIMAIRRDVRIRALAHITGGGIQDNLPRVLPPGVRAQVDRRAFTPNPVFSWIQARSGIDDEEAWHVFNMGCGMIVVVDEADAERCVARLVAAGEEAWPIGRLVSGERGVEYV